MFVSPSQAKELVIDIFKANLVPMLASSPGIGKSSIIREIAKEFRLKLIDIRLSQVDPTELNGFASLHGDKATYKPMDIFPLENEPLPKGYDGWLLFLDELSAAPLATQAAAYKIILDRMIGTNKLHENVVIAAAGNLITDGAVVSRTSTALQSRMVHLHLQVNKDDWVKWAAQNDVDHRVISFINYRPDLLHAFDPKHTDKTFPCPRTWDFASSLAKLYPLAIPAPKLPIFQGTVGEGAGIEFFTFTQIYQDLVSLEDILANPTTCKIPQEPAVLWALTGVIAHNMNADNADLLIQYIDRIPSEFAVLTLRTVGAKNPQLLDIPSINVWLTKAASILL